MFRNPERAPLDEKNRAAQREQGSSTSEGRQGQVRHSDYTADQAKSVPQMDLVSQLLFGRKS